MSRRVTLAVLLFLPGLAACPIPITHTETVSAPMVGVLRQSDDSPVRGAPVAVSGSDCSKPARSGTTDSSGGFSFPATEQQRHVYLGDRVLPSYVLCVHSGDTLLAAYHGRGAIEGPWPADSVTCVQWIWRGNQQTSCRGNSERSLASGGRWIEGEATGWYRVMVAREDTMPPDRRGFDRFWNGRSRPEAHYFVVVQWVEQSDTRHPAIVRWAVEHPLDKHVETAGEVTLEERFGRWCATVNTVRNVRTLYWTSWKRDVVTFTLGPPGQAHPVPDC